LSLFVLYLDDRTAYAMIV